LKKYLHENIRYIQLFLVFYENGGIYPPKKQGNEGRERDQLI